MRTKRSQEGEILIDHRCSPGTALVPGGTVFESPLIVCCHCGVTVVLNPQRTRPRGYCARCDHYVCDSPLCNAHCTPVQQAFDVLRNYLEQTGATSVPDDVLRRVMPSVAGV